MFSINFIQHKYITYKITPIYINLYLCHGKKLPYLPDLILLSFI